MEIVEEWWQGYTIGGIPDFIFMQKLRNLKRDISKSNKEVYAS